MCYQSLCVDSSAYLLNTTLKNLCSPNPCQNGGICSQNATTGTIFCKCAPGKNYAGKIKLLI